MPIQIIGGIVIHIIMDGIEAATATDDWIEIGTDGRTGIDTGDLTFSAGQTITGQDPYAHQG